MVFRSKYKSEKFTFLNFAATFCMAMVSVLGCKAPQKAVTSVSQEHAFIYPAADNIHSKSQYSNHRFEGVLFYNLENLFDTIDGPNDDAEFLPSSENKWNTERYQNKLNNMARVLNSVQNNMGYADINRTFEGKVEPNNFPRLTLMGFVELENAGVMQDLFATWKQLEQKEFKHPEFHYQIVHRESPDKRGIDVSLAYDTIAWKLLKVDMIPVPLPGNYPTRDIMAVHLLHDLTRDTVVVAVNHWPSRRGGAESAPNRAIAAKALRSYLNTPGMPARILVMGDFNDDPNDPSLLAELGAEGLPSPATLNQFLHQSKPPITQQPILYNPAKTYRDSGWIKGSLAYRPYKKAGETELPPVQWNQFDQIIISAAVLEQCVWNHATMEMLRKKGLNRATKADENLIQQLCKHPVAFNVIAPNWLRQHEEPYMDFPLRTFGGKKYLNGYSDHFPVGLLINW